MCSVSRWRATFAIGLIEAAILARRYDDADRLLGALGEAHRHASGGGAQA